MNKLDSKTKPTSAILGLLVLLAIVAIFPHAFAQVSYTDANNPHGPLQIEGWIVGMGTAAALSGVGIWTTIKTR